VKPILLAEGLRSVPLEMELRRPLPLLPVKPGCRLVDVWWEKIEASFGQSEPMDIVAASSEGFQNFESVASNRRFRRTVDPRSHRGTGGILQDLVARDRRAYEDVDWILIIDRDACPPYSLDALAEALGPSIDVVVAVSDLDRLVGMIAIRPRVLEGIASLGYVDLKEQALKDVLASGERGLAVSVMPRAIRVRSLATWLEAVQFHCEESTALEGSRPFLQGCCLIEKSARIGNASILDSIVMEDAIVGDDVVIARSVIPPGVEVIAGTTVIDSVFYGEDSKGHQA